MNLLIIGGSGFVSGTLARLAMEAGHSVWTVTRGERPLPPGVKEITADRKDTSQFASAIAAADTKWDAAVDCIGFNAEDAKEDVEYVLPRTDHLIFVSTDFVYDPAKRSYPQEEAGAHYLEDGYGGGKRAAELVLLDGSAHSTVVRPCHIYGPGSQLGCLPYHSRDVELLARMERGEALTLAGGGHFLQEPLFVEDLARVILDLCGIEKAFSKTLNISGPDCIESRKYYEIIGDCIGAQAAFEEKPVTEALKEHPEWKTFLCHRFYTKDSLAELVKAPSTGIVEGIRRHVEWLRKENS